MTPELKAAVEQMIPREREAVRILHHRAASGGCINNACVLELEDQRRFFLKSNASISVDMFESEAQGLHSLYGASEIKVPEVIGYGTTDIGIAFLLTSFIESGQKKPTTMRDFGRQLASQHKTATSDRFGFDHDNYLGSTPQPNQWTESWCDFWRDQRIGYQLNLARELGNNTPQLQSAGDRFLARIEDWLSDPSEPPGLLHGDLWSGNFMITSDGKAAIIDPAVYYGRREAELAMTELFGGFSSDFYDGYDEAWPLEDGSRERIEIYKLYHLLNHLNLFGSSYLSGCLSILEKYG
ncbi:MAG: hypothetical protein CMJ78_20265 [Planctomycetaceae bacterium]|nr:hypothetical protein [Planctomycetaceae bacterium]